MPISRKGLVVLSLLAVSVSCKPLLAQGTVFTYHGRLNSGANSVNGLYDLIFSLFATNAGGAVVAAPLTNAAVAVTNSLFTVALDFGSSFPGAARWVEMWDPLESTCRHASLSIL